MFGNKDVSATPVSDYYTSPPDVDQSFDNPVNAANMNRGWGIDPSLLTPSHLASYRPQYNGPQPYNEFGRTGFLRGLNQLSPWAKEPVWGNPIAHQQDALEDVSGRPADAAAWAGQRLATPIIGYMAGRAATNALGIGFGTGAKFGSGLGGGLAKGFGMGTPASGGLRATATAVRSAFESGGAGAGFQAIRAIGVGGAANLGARAAMGTAFGAATALAAPLIAGQAIISGAEKGIWDPYVNTRQSARDLRDNFAGVSFADAQGNAVTGKGLGFSESAKMASEITSQGIQDMSLSTGEYRQGADMVGRAGLADNVTSTGITKRIKESMDQVKLIMSIASMPEMKDAIEQLAKLQQSGASVAGGRTSNATEAMNTVGRLASSAGTSVQRLMNTVGAQGQYMYQANGMTPYMGQIAAANSYAALAAGQRMGLIGTAQMARMGGIEGATQSSLAGQMNASQSFLNRMALSNAGATGSTGYGQSSGAVGIATQFGARAASDPLGTIGDMMLNSRQRAANQIKERGTGAAQDQLMSIAKNLPGALDAQGKISAEKAAPLLQTMGMGEDEIKAFFAQNMAETDKDSYAQRQKGINAFTAEQQRQYISQTGTYGGIIGGSIYDIRKAGRAATDAVQKTLVRPVTNFTGAIGDALQKGVDRVWFGPTLDNPENEDVDALLGKAPRADASKTNVSLFKNMEDSAGKDDKVSRTERLKAQSKNAPMFDVAESINELAKKGNEDALSYLNSKDKTEKQKVLHKMVSSEALGKEAKEKYGSFEGASSLNTFLNSADRTVGQDISKPEDSWWRKATKWFGAGDSDEEISAKKRSFSEELAAASGIKTEDKFESLKAAGIAFRLATNKEITPGNIDEQMKTNKDLQEYSKMTGITDGNELMKLASTSAVNSRGSGLVAAAETANIINSKGMSSDDAIKKVAEINGGIHQNGISNAKSITTDEAINGGIQDQQAAREKARNYELMKSGRIDYTTYKQTLNQLDNSKDIEKFGKAIDRFEKAVDRIPGAKKDSDKDGVTPPSMGGGSNQRIVGK